MNEIVEMIYQWHHGKSLKGIQRSLGVDRNTVRKYIEMAQATGVRPQEPFPEETELIGRIKALTDPSVHRERPAQNLILPYRDWIEGLLKAPHMTAKQVWRLFKEEKGISIGYCTMKRYLRSQFQFGAPAVTVRMEVDPGSQAQVDLGYVGKMTDPATAKLRKTWVFIMTLSYSRHRFIRFIFRQDIKNWIDCHRRAFEFFGGVPATVVIDNLKTGVIKADLYDPTLNRAYAEMERHYGFIIDPTKVSMPRHKDQASYCTSFGRYEVFLERGTRSL
jgi:transposase